MVRKAFVLFAIVVTVALTAPALGDDAPPTGNGAKPSTDMGSRRMESRFADGSTLKLTLLDARLRLKTDYGELQIPTADIRRIDFATRLNPKLAERIAAAIIELGHDEYDIRERASQKLAALGAAAYPALLQAAEDTDLEVVHRAEKLLAAIREKLPAEQYEVRADDVVQTAKSKIAGRIEGASLAVDTEPFGRQELSLVHLRSLRSAGAGETETAAAIADPGSLSNYQGQAGKVLRFQVTGGAPAGQFARGGGFVGGAVWGSDIYTLDSTLATAAVHAGVVQTGETSVVTVAILGPQNSFEGSTRNGVASASWGPFPGAFKFIRDE